VEALAPSGWLLPLFFLAALLYSSVGHGGASAYLGILVLAGWSRPEIAPVVLVLNILVTVTGLVNYARAGHFSVRLLLPFVIASIPAAFLGGTVDLPPKLFSAVLGVTLLAAAGRFLFLSRPVQAGPPRTAGAVYGIGIPIGLALGFLAGLIGIGGGIFLSPVILLLGWADAKQTAAVSAAFIVLNSLSGLLAHSMRESLNAGLLIPLAAVVLIGGVAGSWWGAFRVSPVTLQRVLGAVLVTASLKLFIGLW
jgi:uncharacterized membrane protein YfcA